MLPTALTTTAKDVPGELRVLQGVLDKLGTISARGLLTTKCILLYCSAYTDRKTTRSTAFERYCIKLSIYVHNLVPLALLMVLDEVKAGPNLSERPCICRMGMKL